MVRWVVFDDDTAEFVVSRLRRGAAEINHSEPIDAALGVKGEAVLLLPASTPGHLLAARFCKRTESGAAQPASSPGTSALRAKKPAASTPRPWWRRIVA
jgi:hypothetical protein